MAFPASTDALAATLLVVQGEAKALKQYATDIKTASLAGPISANVVVDLYLRLVAAKAKFTAAVGVSGLGAYAQAQLGNGGLDIAAEFTAMNAAIDGVRTWIDGNFPSNAGYILKDQLTAGGVSVRTFSTASLATFRTQLDSLIATIA